MEEKMRIAVLNPVYLFENQDKNFNGYNTLFTKKYVNCIYTIDPRYYLRYKKLVSEWGLNCKVTCSTSVLNKESDIIVSFNGFAYKIQHRIPKRFKGIKIAHVMDYVFCPQKTNRSLSDTGVQYVMGYCSHDKYCKFFSKYYGYKDERVIPVPFGFGKRFSSKTPFDKRINKAIALGSVNPVVEERFHKELKEYGEFYSDKEFTHYLRRAIVVNRKNWGEYIDDKLPTFPEIKNPYYDAVQELNNYTMFINDAGLMNFPPARTYEGIACGAVMVAENLEVYKDLGFKDGYNCILFKKNMYTEMIDKIAYYMKNFDKLFELHKNSIELSKKFTHEKVCDNLYRRISEIYSTYSED